VFRNPIKKCFVTAVLGNKDTSQSEFLLQFGQGSVGIQLIAADDDLEMEKNSAKGIQETKGSIPLSIIFYTLALLRNHFQCDRHNNQNQRQKHG